MMRVYQMLRRKQCVVYGVFSHIPSQIKQVRPFSEKEKLAGTRCVISMTGNQTKILDPAYFDSDEGSSSPHDRSMW